MLPLPLLQVSRTDELFLKTGVKRGSCHLTGELKQSNRAVPGLELAQVLTRTFLSTSPERSVKKPASIRDLFKPSQAEPGRGRRV